MFAPRRPLCLFMTLGAALVPQLASADQLQCNAQGVAQAAVEMLPPGSIFIDFCSLCEAKVQVVRVESARAVKDCDFEVEVVGTVVTETSQAFNDGYVAGQAKFIVPSTTANSAIPHRSSVARKASAMSTGMKVPNVFNPTTLRRNTKSRIPIGTASRLR